MHIAVRLSVIAAIVAAPTDFVVVRHRHVNARGGGATARYDHAAHYHGMDRHGAGGHAHVHVAIDGPAKEAVRSVASRGDVVIDVDVEADRAKVGKQSARLPATDLSLIGLLTETAGCECLPDGRGTERPEPPPPRRV
ncbi:MAG: hypothetical protein AAGJ97_07070 [Planctomycetota bacterium]